MKTRWLYHWTALFLFVSTTVSNAAEGDPAVRNAREKFQARRTYAQGVTIGTVLGGMVGMAAGGLLAAANKGNVAQGVAVGGVTGAALGGQAGANVARRKIAERRAYAGRESALENAIGNARSTRLEARNFNRALATGIKNAHRNAALRAGTIDDARKVDAALTREIKRQRDALAEAESRNIPSADRNKLNSEISGLVAEQRRLEDYVEQLAPGTLHKSLL